MTGMTSPPAPAEVLQTMRLEIVDDLVAHLVTARGHALLEGAVGSGLGTALRAFLERLHAEGVSVRELPLEALRPGGRGPDDETAAVLDDGDGVEVLVVDVRDLVGMSPVGADATTTVVDVERLVEVMSTHHGTPSPVLVVCPTDPATAPVAATAHRFGARHFVLRPWGEPQVRSLLEARGLDTSVAARVTARSGGLPWLVSRCCRPGNVDGDELPDDDFARSAVLRLVDSCSDTVVDAALALAVGYPTTGRPMLPMAAGDAAAQEDILGRVAGAGLLGADGTLPPLVREGLLAHAPPHRLDRWRTQLVDDIVVSGLDLSHWAEDLVAHGYQGPMVDAALVRRATELRADDPAVAARTLRQAMHGSTPDARLRVELCRLLLLAGDVPAAARELEQTLATLGDTVPPGLVPVGLNLSWVQDQPQRALDLIHWAGAKEPSALAYAEVALTRYAAGDRAGGDAALEAVVRTPDLVTGTGVQTAEGLRASLGREPLSGLPAIMQAADAAGTAEVPVFPATSPAAYAALVGLHHGDLDLVRSVIGSALESRSLGVPARRQLSMLQAWADIDAVPAAVTNEVLDSLTDLVPRDALWAAALRVRVARRSDDPARLRREWADVREVVLRHPVSLWQLLPLGELALTAARMHEFALVRPVWRQAEALLDRLGDPPLWATPFHWTGVLIALQLDHPHEAAPHASALVRAAEHWPHAGVLAAAGRAWVHVRARDVDAAEVERAALDLSRAGFPWEAARLAAHGAAATDDRRLSARLLECARGLKPRPEASSAPQSHHPVQNGDGGRSTRSNGTLRLTERERQVAELVLEGRTYRQVGEILFLSAKTVEHHVARIRRRSGASSREELMELLSAELGTGGDGVR